MIETSRAEIFVIPQSVKENSKSGNTNLPPMFVDLCNGADPIYFHELWSAGEDIAVSIRYDGHRHVRHGAHIWLTIESGVFYIKINTKEGPTWQRIVVQF